MTTGPVDSMGAHVVVVGGGLAGITSALACADRGAEVSLFESRRTLGGAATSLRRDGLEIDVGQHVFLRCCTAYRRLLSRLGSAHLAVLQDRLDIAVAHPDGRHGRLRRGRLPAPLHLAPALAAYPFLTPRERARAALTAARLRRLTALDPDLDGQTFGAWLAARGESPGAIAALWDLIGLPTLNLRADQASLLLATRVFQVGLLTRADAADVGMSTVPLAELHARPALARLREAGVRVRTGAPVLGIGGATSVQSVALKEGSSPAQRVILAVPPRAAARLLPATALADPASLSRLESSAIVTAHLLFDRPVMSRPFFAALDSPVQWAFDRSGSIGLPRGRYVVVTLSGADDLLREPTDALHAVLVPALARLLPAVRQAHLERFLVTRDRAATFRQGPGTAPLRPGPRTGVRGLFLAGSYTDTGWPDTMESAVLSGLRAADAALACRNGSIVEGAA